jgi:hypothetical protein
MPGKLKPPLYPSTRADYFAELELATIDALRAVTACDFNEAEERAIRFLNLIASTTGNPNPHHDRIRKSVQQIFYPSLDP